MIPILEFGTREFLAHTLGFGYEMMNEFSSLERVIHVLHLVRDQFNGKSRASVFTMNDMAMT